jgi:hypothetical protein
MALERFRAPPLPNPPQEYDPTYVRQLIRVLELYFTQLDSFTPNQAQSYRADNFYGGAFSGDGKDISTPFNQLLSNTSQTAAAIDIAYALTLDTSEFPDGISIISSSRITFASAGIYVLSYSIQLESASTTTEHADIWLRKNGTDIPASNSRFGIAARKSAGVPAALIAVTPLTISVAANDYIQIMWCVSNTSVSIKYYPAAAYSAGVTPAVPATPSAIVGVSFASAT